MQGLEDTNQQYLHLEEGTVSGHSPSQSVWVVDKNKENERLGLSKPKWLSSIDEAGPVTSFASLSISSSTEHPASSYSPPTPYAPLLPEEASWFHNGDILNRTESFYDQTRFMKPNTNLVYDQTRFMDGNQLKQGYVNNHCPIIVIIFSHGRNKLSLE